MTRATKENEESICLWCGKPTNAKNGREHIFPFAIGGKKTLPVGSVCKKCNNRLGFLDKCLKYGHGAMMDAFQADSRIKGRIRDKDDRERKSRERTYITGKGEAKDTKISREDSDVYLTNVNFIVTSKNFVRALHKCTSNALCYSYGSATTRENYRDLIKFVNDGGNVRPWSYAVSFPNPFKRPLISEPKPFLIKVNRENENVVGFIHTSGIWITGSQPFLLNRKVIEAVSDIIAEKIASVKEPDTKKSAIDFFGFNWDLSKGRIGIGKLKFLWIVKEIQGTPNDRFLYLLTKCEVCGQTNPTGITLPREIIYNGNVSKAIPYDKNTWNCYTLEDLKKLGLKVEKWDKNSLEKYMAKGISIPIENDVRKLKIQDCKTVCINCGALIDYDANDCFV